jgi:hypothetical protein
MKSEQTRTEVHVGFIDLALTQLAAKNPQGVGILIIVPAGAAAPPSTATRVAAVEMGNKHSGHLLGVAFVLQGEGLKASIMRVVVNAMSLATRSKRIKLFSDVAAAAQWLAPHLVGTTPPVTAQQLIDASKRLSQQHA